MSSEPEAEIPASRGRRKPSRSAWWQKWSRLIHVYTSMICLALVLFFSVTGLTLNHPTWGSTSTSSVANGTLPANWKTGETIDWLTVSEYLRNTNGVNGMVLERRQQDGEATITFKGPGSSASATINEATGAYEVNTLSVGLVGFMNDLHKGRNTTTSWKWVIDVSAVVLVVISLSGLLLQFFLKRRRQSAYVTAGAGVVLCGLLMYWAVG